MSKSCSLITHNSSLFLRRLRRRLRGGQLRVRLREIGRVDVVYGGGGGLAAEGDVLAECDHRDFGFEGGGVVDEPGVILVLARVLTQAHDLSRAGLAGDVEAEDARRAARAARLVDDGPHAVNDEVVLVGGDVENL